MDLKVATYNFCQGGADFNALHHVLATLKPDILFAQELLDPQRYLDKGNASWSSLGYRDPIWCAVPGNSKRWGSAIFTTRDAARTIDIPESLQGWVVGIELDLSEIFAERNGPWKLFSVHTPTRRESNYICEAQKVLEFIGTQQPDASMFVAGDFNVTTSVRGQSEKQMTPMEQEIVIYCRRSLGLINCWQASNPNCPVPNTFHGLSLSHLDGILISARWYRYLKTSYIVGADRDWTTGDHYPVIAEFDSDRPAFRTAARRESSSDGT